MALTEFRSQPRIVPETSIATRIPLRGAGAHDVVSSPGWEHAAMRRAGSGPRPRLAIEEQAPQPLSVRAHAGAPRDGRLNLLRPENVRGFPSEKIFKARESWVPKSAKKQNFVAVEEKKLSESS